MPVLNGVARWFAQNLTPSWTNGKLGICGLTDGFRITPALANFDCRRVADVHHSIDLYVDFNVWEK